MKFEVCRRAAARERSELAATTHQSTYSIITNLPHKRGNNIPLMFLLLTRRAILDFAKQWLSISMMMGIHLFHLYHVSVILFITKADTFHSSWTRTMYRL